MGPVQRAELALRLLEMAANGLLAEPEQFGNPLIRAPQRDEAQDRQLPGSEANPVVGACRVLGDLIKPQGGKARGSLQHNTDRRRENGAEGARGPIGKEPTPA